MGLYNLTTIKIQWELKLCNEILELFFSLWKFTFFEEMKTIVECQRQVGGVEGPMYFGHLGGLWENFRGYFCLSTYREGGRIRLFGRDKEGQALFWYKLEGQPRPSSGSSQPQPVNRVSVKPINHQPLSEVIRWETWGSLKLSTLNWEFYNMRRRYFYQREIYSKQI